MKESWRLGLLDAEEYQRAADVGDIRAAALLAVLYGCGLRRAEAVGLDSGDYHPETRALTVRHGKGEKARIVYLPASGAALLADWLRLRPGDRGPLFLPINKGGRVTLRRMAPQSIYDLLARRTATAAVARVSPHDLRRTFVSDLLDAGVDLGTVQKLAGHASIATTTRYDRRGEHAKRQAADVLHIPSV